VDEAGLEVMVVASGYVLGFSNRRFEVANEVSDSQFPILPLAVLKFYTISCRTLEL
jgi:hypothetical protein